jgi:hypothetical protein
MTRALLITLLIATSPVWVPVLIGLLAIALVGLLGAYAIDGLSALLTGRPGMGAL